MGHYIMLHQNKFHIFFNNSSIQTIL